MHGKTTNDDAVNTVVDRSVAYSADSAGEAGRIGAHVVRSIRVADERIAFAIAVRNETTETARITAYVPPDGLHAARTLAQSLVGPFADFATTVEIVADGGAPALRVDIVAGTIVLDLVVPGETTGAEPAAAPGSSLATIPRSAVPARIEAGALPSLIPARPHAGAEYDHDEIVAASRGGPPFVPVFLAFALAMAGAAAFIARPTVNATLANAAVRPGARVPVTYRATGIGNASFALLDADGVEIEHGSLPSGTGSFDVTLPGTGDGHAYLFRVALDGPLGRAVDERYVHVDAPASAPTARPVVRPAPPAIRSLTLDRGTVDGGAPINVYYDVAATSGTVALVDGGAQLSYGKAPLEPGGHAAFTAPAVTAPRILTVVITAARGGASTQARIGVTVAPAPSPTPADAADAGVAADPGAAPLQAPVAAPVVTAPARVRSGDAVRIGVRSAAIPVSLVLVDAAGGEIARRDVAPGTNVTVFTAPTVTSAERVRLEASYALGAGRETIVDAIEIEPR